MLTHLYLAPAAAGKTEYTIHLARQAARGLAAEVHVCVPTGLQAHAFRRRLAQAGGAIGVRVLVFDQLVAACLNAAGESYSELSEAVQLRLIRAVIDETPLDHYAPLAHRPGFVQVLQRRFAELKAALIDPAKFAAISREPRLSELAQLYTRYQATLQAQQAADRVGLHWLAVAAMRRHPAACCDWPLLLVDGFDDLSPAQSEMLHELTGRVGELIITLTGSADPAEPSPPFYGRFDRTRQLLERALSITAEPLPPFPASLDPFAPPLRHLATHLFQPPSPFVVAALAAKETTKVVTTNLTLIEAPDRTAEVRAALRWLKKQLVVDGRAPADVALLARTLQPYRSFIRQIAAEFGLPIHLADGLPLSGSPIIAALLDLLRLFLPAAGNEPALPRRLVIEAWRSPYFDWSALPHPIQSGDADRLDATARYGRVIGGLSQWQEALRTLARTEPDDLNSEDEEQLAARPPSRNVVNRLAAVFHDFRTSLTPPPGAQTTTAFVQWLETLIGPAPLWEKTGDDTDPSFSLNLIGRLHTEPEPSSNIQPSAFSPSTYSGQALLPSADMAALQTLKEILRGLVCAENAIPDGKPVDYTRFLAELTGAVNAAFYQESAVPNSGEILVAGVTQARGLPFQAVAVLGLAEGEFPAPLTEDPFLRDEDRQRLLLEPSTRSTEQEFFYETITRPTQALLLTRPRLSETGAEWLPSPFWDAVRRVVNVTPQQINAEQPIPPTEAASWPELLESLAQESGEWGVGSEEWRVASEEWRLSDHRPPTDDRSPLTDYRLPITAYGQLATLHSPLPTLHSITAGANILRQRHTRQSGRHDGNLTDLQLAFNDRFGHDHTWSISRLETYGACHYRFFVTHVLGAEARSDPVEGLDARQLGNIYHHIFEAVYQSPTPDADDETAVLARVTSRAAPILDAAPQTEGFRVTAWWAQTREEIIANVTRSIIALAGKALSADFTPWRFEMWFSEEARLTLEDGDDRLHLRGIIDRIDRNPQGQLRVIDYKLPSPARFRAQDVTSGRTLQLPLYALAAETALRLGPVTDGFYWHVQKAEASPFTLATFDSGPQAAIHAAVTHAWAAAHGVRAGAFQPQPPADGCPAYCPAAAFCYHYRPGRMTR